MKFGDEFKLKVAHFCGWCGEELPSDSPPAKKFHDGDCKLYGYREGNARHARAFRFRREMGFAKRK